MGPLKNIEAIFKDALNPYMVLVADAPRFTIVAVNDAFARVTGITASNAIGKGVFEVFPEAKCGEDPLKDRLEQVLATKLPLKAKFQKYELQMPGAVKTEVRYWLPECFPVLNGDGEPELIIHSMADVTEQVEFENKAKRSTIELLKNQEQYRSLFDYHPDSVVAFDLEGNFISANPSMARMAECSVDEVLQLCFQNLIAPEDTEMVAAHFQQAAQGHIQNYITGLITATGKRLIVEATLIPIIVNKEIIGVFGIGKNVTKQMEADRLLKQQQEQLRQIMNHSLDVICTVDADGRFVQVSKASEHVLGYLPEELKGTRYIDLVHSDDVKMTLQTADDITRGISTRGFVNRYKRKDGVLITMEWSAHWEAAEAMWYCVARDVTKDIEVSKAIKSNEKRFRTLLQNSADGLALVAADGILLEISETGRKLLGYSEAELIGQIKADLIHADDLPLISAAFLDVLKEDKKKKCFEFRVLVTDGTYKWIEADFQNQLHEPSVAAVVMNFRDISDRKHFVTALDLSERRFKSLVQEGSDLINVLDNEGKYKYATPASLAMMGITAEELMGKSAFHYIHEDDRETIIQSLAMVAKTKRIKTKPFRFKDVSGEYRWLESIGTNLLDDPAVEGIVVNSNDVTDRLKYVQEVECQNEQLRKIAWSQSHMVRAPLSRIMGLVNILTNYPSSRIEEKTLFDALLLSATELDDIIRDIVKQTALIEKETTKTP